MANAALLEELKALGKLSDSLRQNVIEPGMEKHKSKPSRSSSHQASVGASAKNIYTRRSPSDSTAALVMMSSYNSRRRHSLLGAAISTLKGSSWHGRGTMQAEPAEGNKKGSLRFCEMVQALAAALRRFEEGDSEEHAKVEVTFADVTLHTTAV
jgi:hypothetical protein